MVLLIWEVSVKEDAQREKREKQKNEEKREKREDAKENLDAAANVNYIIYNL